jgi:hypothetical protein
LDGKSKAKILFEISQIEKLLNKGEPLLDLCKRKEPDFTEISAAALLLHSFYNGIENILIQILKSYNEELPQGNRWHTELLEKSFVSNNDRKQIFRTELQDILEEYLKFRHFIRHSYGFLLEWESMEELTNCIKTVWQDVKEDINNIITSNQN